MPSSSESPRRAILCDGSELSFLKYARNPDLSTVKTGFEEITQISTHDRLCLIAASATIRKKSRVSSIVSRLNSSAFKYCGSMVILYNIFTACSASTRSGCPGNSIPQYADSPSKKTLVGSKGK